MKERVKKNGKKLSKRIVALIVCAAIILALLIAFTGLCIGNILVDRIICWRPDYAMLSSDEMTKLISKSELSEEDYKILYDQTGLTKLGIDRIRAHGSSGVFKLLQIQKDYFAEHTVEHEKYAPLIGTDFVEDFMHHIYLEDGDIVVTSSTHIAGWRIGHCGLITNGNADEVLVASVYGESSSLSTILDFSYRVNFAILSPKTDKETKKQVTDFAKTELVGKTYDLTTGVLSNKQKVERTQCAHIVWYAYNKFGLDLDSTGGPVVSPKDIMNSENVELVQTFGFNPQQLWK